MDHNQRYEASRSEEGSFRLLVEAITDYAICMLDLEGKVTNWNAGARRFDGYEADEIVGEHFSRFYTDEDRASGQPQCALETAARKGKFESKGWRIRKGGGRYWAHVVIDPIRDPAGQLVGYAQITRDLTERMIADQALRRSEQQFTMLVQSVTDFAIYMLDPDGFVSSWNIGAERIKGYSRDEIIGSHFSRFYTDEDRAAGEPQRALATAINEGRYAREGFRVRKDGSHFWATVVIDPIRDDSGKLVGFAKVTRDITDRRKVQDELDHARETLFQARKMEAIGQLTGGVAHDFNNLLMAVLSSLSLLRKRLPQDNQSLRLLDNAVAGAERGTALTQRMLAFARRQDLKRERIDIPRLVDGMADLIQRSLGPMIIIETRFPKTLNAVSADTNQVEMALLNLVVNARDAMPGGGKITITAQDHDLVAPEDGMAAGRYVSLRVVDTGEGMDADALRRATEPFFTTKGVGKGTGLGLPMVHGLARQSGGRFTLQSEPGKGTIAELWLPISNDAPAPVPAAQPAEPSATDSRVLTILAVDDDSLVLMNTAALLEDMGHQVFEAYSGEEALDIFKREPGIDLVITDQAMPYMTGIDLADKIKGIRPGTPIILATGYGELPPGADATILKLGKPFGQRDLADALEKLLPPQPQDAAA